MRGYGHNSTAVKAKGNSHLYIPAYLQPPEKKWHTLGILLVILTPGKMPRLCHLFLSPTAPGSTEMIQGVPIFRAHHRSDQHCQGADVKRYDSAIICYKDRRRLWWRLHRRTIHHSCWRRRNSGRWDQKRLQDSVNINC